MVEMNEFTLQDKKYCEHIDRFVDYWKNGRAKN